MLEIDKAENGGGRVEDVAIFIRSDKNGQDQECVGLLRREDVQ